MTMMERRLARLEARAAVGTEVIWPDDAAWLMRARLVRHPGEAPKWLLEKVAAGLPSVLLALYERDPKAADPARAAWRIIVESERVVIAFLNRYLDAPAGKLQHPGHAPFTPEPEAVVREVARNWNLATGAWPRQETGEAVIRWAEARGPLPPMV